MRIEAPIPNKNWIIYIYYFVLPLKWCWSAFEVMLKCLWSAVEVLLKYYWTAVELPLNCRWSGIEVLLKCRWSAIEVPLKCQQPTATATDLPLLTPPLSTVGWSKTVLFNNLGEKNTPIFWNFFSSQANIRITFFDQRSPWPPEVGVSRWRFSPLASLGYATQPPSLQN